MICVDAAAVTGWFLLVLLLAGFAKSSFYYWLAQFDCVRCNIFFNQHLTSSISSSRRKLSIKESNGSFQFFSKIAVMWNPQGSKIKSKNLARQRKICAVYVEKRGLEIHAMIESKI